MGGLVDNPIAVGGGGLEPPAAQGINKGYYRVNGKGKDVLAYFKAEVAESVGSGWFRCSFDRPS